MRQFVAEHAFEFFVIEQAQRSLRDRHCGVARIAAGGEGVGRFLRADVDARHGQAGALRERADHFIEFRRRLLINFLPAHCSDSDLVGKEIGAEVDRQREDAAEQHALHAPEVADPHQQAEQRGQQKRSFKIIFKDEHGGRKKY